MKFKPSNIIWGLCFIIIGILLYCKTFLGWDISLWNILWRCWPLFIIIPSITGICSKGFNLSSFIWLLVGTAFLLMTNNIVSGSLIRRLVIPVSLVIIGIAIIFKDAFSKGNKNRDTSDTFNNYDSNNSSNGFTYNSHNDNNDSQNTGDKNSDFFSSDSTSRKKPEYNAIFGSNQVKYPNDIFFGTCINSVFGSVVLDLRDAIITEDVVINASVIFAGADIYVPGNVNIKVSSIPIFGGVSDKTINGNVTGRPTIFVNATCMFGGLDIK